MLPAILALSLLVPAADPPAKLSDAAQKELKKLEGKWTLAKEVSTDGEKEPNVNGEPIKVEFKGRKLLVNSVANFEFEIAALDPTSDPKLIDWKCTVDAGPLSKGAVLEAIYKLDGETLTFALHTGEGKKRPANFDPPKENGTIVVTLKRVKD